jgi:hypothetical protein
MVVANLVICGAFSNGYYDGFEVAFQSPQGHLCVYHSAGNTTNFCTGLGASATICGTTTRISEMVTAPTLLSPPTSLSTRLFWPVPVKPDGPDYALPGHNSKTRGR